MKILYISHYSDLGGAQQSLINLIESLRQYGITAMVFIPHDGPVTEVFRQKNIPFEIHRFASLRGKDRGRCINCIEGLIRRSLNVLQSIRLSGRVKREFDLIHANSSLAFFGVNLKRRTHLPLVWHVREFGDIDYSMVYYLSMQQVAQSYETADRVIAISDVMRQHYAAHVSSGAKYIRIYNEVSVQGICKRTVPFGSTLRLVMVGGISRAKNQIEVLKAVQILRNQHIPVSIDLYGTGDDAYIQELTQWIQQAGLQDYVHLKGQNNDVRAVLHEYHVGIMPSKKEAFGRVTIEFMLAKLCVIASNSGANPELITHKKNGVLYELGNASDLAAKISDIYQNPKLAEQISEQGYQTALNAYASGKSVKQVYDLYRTLI